MNLTKTLALTTALLHGLDVAGRRLRRRTSS